MVALVEQLLLPLPGWPGRAAQPVQEIHLLSKHPTWKQCLRIASPSAAQAFQLQWTDDAGGAFTIIRWEGRMLSTDLSKCWYSICCCFISCTAFWKL